MISNKNFSGIDPAALPLDAEYERCNFSRAQADLGPPIVGIRLFPGDDTPRTFIQCNLVNCEPPPGSTLIRCNTALIEDGVLVETDTVLINGVVVATNNRTGKRIHGRYNGDTGAYQYLTTPDLIEDKL